MASTHCSRQAQPRSSPDCHEQRSEDQFWEADAV